MDARGSYLLPFNLEQEPAPPIEQPIRRTAERCELKLISVPGIRREDDSIERRMFAACGASEFATIPSPIKVVLKQEAPARFSREALLAFAVGSQPGSDDEIPSNVVEAVVTVTADGRQLYRTPAPRSAIGSRP
jgi:hypothetical protein